MLHLNCTIMLNVTSIPLGICIYGRPKKPWLGAAIGAAGGLASSLIGAGIQHSNTKAQQRLQSALNKQEMSYSNSLQRDQQEWLMNTQYGKQVSGMINAGLNPATANGTTPSVPSASTPHSGASGPSAGMPDIMGSVSQGSLLGAQIDNITADTKKKESEKNRIDQQIKIDTWMEDPEVQSLRKSGLESEVLLTYAQADFTKEDAVRVGKQVQLMTEQLNLTKEQQKVCQQQAALYVTESLKLLQDMKESDVRIALHYAEMDLKRSERDLNRAKIGTEKASQFNLYASGEHHYSSSFEQNTKGHLNKAQESESKLRTVGQEIANRAAKFKQEVVEASGGVTEQGSLLGAKRIISLINPLSDIK